MTISVLCRYSWNWCNGVAPRSTTPGCNTPCGASFIWHLLFLLDTIHHGENHVIFEEIPQARHVTSAGRGECPYSQLHRFTEVFWGLLEFQGGLLGYSISNVSRHLRWLEGLATAWVRAHRECLLYQTSLESGVKGCPSPPAGTHNFA